jgi:hypothetical protein
VVVLKLSFGGELAREAEVDQSVAFFEIVIAKLGYFFELSH